MLALLLTVDDEIVRSKLEAVYNAYSDAMYYRAYAILQNAQDAEDAVHAAFVKLLKNIDRLPEGIGSRTRSYVIIAAENSAIDLYRKQKREKETPLDDELPDPSGGYEYSGQNEITRQIFKLPPKFRNVLLLKYIHGFTYAEIAKMLGTNENAAKKTGQRAKEKLEELCRKEGLL